MRWPVLSWQCAILGSRPPCAIHTSRFVSAHWTCWTHSLNNEVTVIAKDSRSSSALVQQGLSFSILCKPKSKFQAYWQRCWRPRHIVVKAQPVGRLFKHPGEQIIILFHFDRPSDSTERTPCTIFVLCQSSRRSRMLRPGCSGHFDWRTGGFAKSRSLGHAVLVRLNGEDALEMKLSSYLFFLSLCDC